MPSFVVPPARIANPAHLAARPLAHAAVPARTGTLPLRLGGVRDGLLYVPTSYRADRPAPLLVMLHGAGATGRQGIDVVARDAEERGVLVLAPDSRDRSWDAIVDDLGPDVAFLDRALANVFARYAVDPAHVAIGGFSDGASYALTIGLANGDLFSTVLAFAPGFQVAPARVGRPRVFVSHGTADPVLPIDRCSRRLVPWLQREGYDVRYHEFDGGHWPLAADVHDGIAAWLAAPPR